MTTTDMTTTDDTNESASLADRLPELDDEETQWAIGNTQKSWAYYNLGQGIGYVWTMPDYGIAMQVASEDTIRVLTVVDHEWCIKTLSYMMATLRHLGIEVDLSNAIIAEYVEGNNVTGTPSGTDLVRGEAEDDAVEVV